VDLSKVHAPVK